MKVYWLKNSDTYHKKGCSHIDGRTDLISGDVEDALIADKKPCRECFKRDMQSVHNAVLMADGVVYNSSLRKYDQVRWVYYRFPKEFQKTVLLYRHLKKTLDDETADNDLLQFFRTHSYTSLSDDSYKCMEAYFGVMNKPIVHDIGWFNEQLKSVSAGQMPAKQDVTVKVNQKPVRNSRPPVKRNTPNVIEAEYRVKPSTSSTRQNKSAKYSNDTFAKQPYKRDKMEITWWLGNAVLGAIGLYAAIIGDSSAVNVCSVVVLLSMLAESRIDFSIIPQAIVGVCLGYFINKMTGMCVLLLLVNIMHHGYKFLDEFDLQFAILIISIWGLPFAGIYFVENNRQTTSPPAQARSSQVSTKTYTTRTYTVTCTKKEQYNNKVGNEWKFTDINIYVNGIPMGHNGIILQDGDRIQCYAILCESDDSYDDYGEVADYDVHTVTSAKLQKEFAITVPNVIVTESGGPYNGNTACFDVTFHFKPTD